MPQCTPHSAQPLKKMELNAVWYPGLDLETNKQKRTLAGEF
jgi:hypothetical protein